MKIHAKSFLAAVAVQAVVLCAPAAFAQAPNNPVGLWNVQAYFDNTPAINPAGTQNICFLANGTWYSPTFPNWNGRWFQKGNNAAGNGDRVRILGNWAFGAGNDSAELSFINLGLMTGGWHEWTDGFGAVLWLQLVGRRIGTACPPPLSVDSAAVDDSSRRPWEERGASPPACEATN